MSLGWKPKVNLKEGIQKAYAAYEAMGTRV